MILNVKLLVEMFTNVVEWSFATIKHRFLTGDRISYSACFRLENLSRGCGNGPLLHRLNSAPKTIFWITFRIPWGFARLWSNYDRRIRFYLHNRHLFSAQSARKAFICVKSGEQSETWTQDPVIKSHVVYPGRERLRALYTGLLTSVVD